LLLRWSPLLLLLAACEPSSPAPPPPRWSPPPVAPSVPPPPPLPAPPISRVHLRWSSSCDTVRNPCEIDIAGAAPDGTLFAGGGSYDTFSFAGSHQPHRAYEQLVLAAFEPDGKARWLKALGTQWHNKVDQVATIDDVVIVRGTHANGFDAGGKRLPDLAVRHVVSGGVAQDMAFETETSFLAGYRPDGKLIWAKNMMELVGPSSPELAKTHGSGVMYPAERGLWLTVGQTNDVRIAHLDADGTIGAPRSVLGQAIHYSATLTRSGDLVWVEGMWPSQRDPALTVQPQFFVRVDVSGHRFVTPLNSGLDLPPTAPKSFVSLSRSRLLAGDDGSARVLFQVDLIAETTIASWVVLLQLDARGTLVGHHVLIPPVTLPKSPREFSLFAAQPLGDGLRIGLRHSGPLTIGATIVPGPSWPEPLGQTPQAATFIDFDASSVPVAVRVVDSNECLPDRLVDGPAGKVILGTGSCLINHLYKGIMQPVRASAAVSFDAL
jgi:hypothetical protein